jgi:tetratricopeptide (TPR) repeat protein
VANWGWTTPRQHFFGPERIGHVCRRTGGGWRPVLPARLVLRLIPGATGLVLERVPPPGATVARRSPFLAVDCQPALLEPILSTLTSIRRHIGELDLSRVDPAQLASWQPPNRNLRVRALVVPQPTSPEQLHRWAAQFSSRAVRTQSSLQPPVCTPGDPERLRAVVAEAVAKHAVAAPDNASGLRQLAETYLDANRPELALAVLASSLAKQRSWAYLVVADALLRLNELPAALAAYDAAGQLGEPLGFVLAKRADALRLAGQTAEAIRLADRALEQDPNSAFARAVAGLAYHADGHPIAAAMLRDQLSPGDENHRLLTALIEAGNLPAGGSKLFLPGSRHAGRRAEAAWLRVLAENPNHALALRRLADVQRRLRPWSAKWAGTQLHAVDASPPAVREGHRLAGLAISHPRSLSALLGALVGALWFELAITGVVPHVSVGWPMVAAAAVGASAFGLLRRQLPERAKAAARSLGHRPRGIWTGYAAVATVGLVLGVPGWAVVKPDHSCRTARGCTPAPRIPPVPSIVLPSIPAGPSFPGRNSIPGLPSFPRFPSLPGAVSLPWGPGPPHVLSRAAAAEVVLFDGTRW